MNSSGLKYILTFAFALALILVSGCASDQEKAEKLLTESQTYYDNGEYNKASIQVQNAIKLKPDSAEGYALLAEIQMKLGKANDAFTAYQKLEQLAPDNLEAKIKAAFFFLLKKDIPSAEKRINTVLEKEPENVEAMYVLGSIQIARGEPRKVILDTYLKILEIDPKQARAHITLARQYGKTGELEKVEHHLKSAVEAQPGNKSYYKSLTAYYIFQKRYSDAKHVLDQMQQKFEKDSEPHILLSNLYTIQKQNKKAEEALLEAINVDSKNIKPYMIYAQFLASQKRFDDAEKYFTAAMDLEPDNLAIKITFANYFFSNQQYNKAKAIVDKLLEKQPDYLDAKTLQARLFMADRKIDEALTLLQSLVKEDPNSITINYLLGSCYFEKNQYSQAQIYLNKVLERNANVTQALILLSDLQYRTGQLDQGKANIQKALAAIPDNYNANVIFGNINIAQGNYSDAKIIFNDLIRQAPDNPVAYFRIGVINRFMEEYDDAIKHLNKALDLNPKLMDVFVNLITVYSQTKAYDKAIAKCDAHLEKVRDESAIAAIVMYYKGTIHLEMKQYDDGEKLLRQSIETNQKYITPYMTLAKLQMSQGKVDQAIQTYLDLIEHRPNQAAPHSLLGSIYERQQKSAEAEQHYKKALEIDPDFIPAMNNLAFLYAEQNRELNKALDLARSAKEKANNSTAVMDTLGWVYLKKQLYDSAVQEFKSCININPSNPIFHYHLGIAYQEQGKKELARQSLEKSLELKVDFPGADDARNRLNQL